MALKERISFVLVERLAELEAAFEAGFQVGDRIEDVHEVLKEVLDISGPLRIQPIKRRIPKKTGGASGRAVPNNRGRQTRGKTMTPQKHAPNLTSSEKRELHVVRELLRISEVEE